MRLRVVARVVAFATAGLLAACSTMPQRSLALAKPAFDFDAALAAVHASGVARAGELDVQPLVDSADVDLQQQARRDMEAGRARQAAAVLDLALAAHPANPVLLQERAEVALVLHHADDAMRYARASHAHGPTAGALCRRALETQLQVAMGTAMLASEVTALHSARDACTVTPPPRY